MRTRNPLLALAAALWLLAAGAGHTPADARADSARYPSTPAVARAAEPTEIFPGAAGKEYAVIRLLYSSLEEAIAKSGFQVSFNLEDFRTYSRGQFHKTLLLDVITLHAPTRLRIATTEVEATDGSLVGRSFEPAWRNRFTIEDVAVLDQWMAQFEGTTLADALSSPDADIDHQFVFALTSYRVRAVFDGRSETYRAAVKWVRRPIGPSAVTLMVEDHVTDAVESGVLAGYEIAPVSALLSGSFRATGSPGPASQEAQ